MSQPPSSPNGEATARPSAGTVAVVDDEPTLLAAVERTLRRESFEVRRFSTAVGARDALLSEGLAVDVVLTDIHMPEMDGLELLALLKAERPELPVIMMTGRATVQVAVEAMRHGAYDFLMKPFEAPGSVVAAVERAMSYRRLLERNLELEMRLASTQRFENIVGSSSAIRAVFDLIRSVAPTDATVLIVGESGTGKELVARAMHDMSARSGKRFVAINCGALTESVLESELFGHVRGAFTGATTSRRGLFEEASGGTLLLDEVGELTAATQVRLLRVLQEREVRPLGSNQSRPVDVRVVAATHRDLDADVKAGRFRQDLFYRLAVVTVEVPPLRQRAGDIPLLTRHFIDKHAARLGRAATTITPEAIECLRAHGWPGNVRELENAVERALVLGKSDALRLEDLPSPLWRATRPASPASEAPLTPLAEARDAFVQRYLERALGQVNGNFSEAAALAGMDRSNFRRLLKRHGLRGDGSS